ncbi:hypothetical protein KI387_001536, partial [Taxus chinensis]
MMGSPSNTNAAAKPMVSDESLREHNLTPSEIKAAEPSSDTNTEFYTIPGYARWFSWNKIHETERIFLREFFDGRSSSKTPKIYKEYRDFMINKYRENPLQRVTFTEMRKMLVGDVSSIHKVFDFLETWGLINFQAPSDSKSQSSNKDFPPVVLDNLPNGIRVVTPPKSARHMMSPCVKGKKFGRKVRVGEGATLASYKDVFDLEKATETKDGSEMKSTGLERQSTSKLFCNNCRAECTASCFNCQKAGFVLCPKCFEDENYGLGLSAADFTRHDLHQESIEVGADGWTDEETLLLLEGTLFYSDDWKHVAQHVRTKNETDCIMKLIQLPFGEQFMVNAGIEGNDNRSSNAKNENKAADQAFSLKDSSAQNYQEDDSEEEKHTTDIDVSGPPLKRSRLTPLADVGNSLMGQVAFLSTMVGPRVAAAAAEAAIAALCEEDPSASQIICGSETKSLNQKYESSFAGLELDSTRKSFEPEECNKELEGTLNVIATAGTDEDLKGDFRSSAKSLPATHLQMRAAIATALGAAGAHAKLLADQEERDIEHLMSMIIENQLKKMYLKIRHFEEIETIMEKEYSLMEQIKELLLTERMHIIRETLNYGFSG